MWIHKRHSKNLNNLHKNSLCSKRHVVSNEIVMEKYKQFLTFVKHKFRPHAWQDTQYLRSELSFLQQIDLICFYWNSGMWVGTSLVIHLCPQKDNFFEKVKKRCVSMWLGYFLLFFFLFLFVSSSSVCVVHWSTAWTVASNVKTFTLHVLSVSSISSGVMNSVSKPFINLSISSSLSLWTASKNVNSWSVEASLSIWKCLFRLLFIFQVFTYKPFKITPQLTCLMD